MANREDLDRIERRTVELARALSHVSWEKGRNTRPAGVPNVFRRFGQVRCDDD